MDIATAEQQRRVEARAVGRTPEEHAALERALARRRAWLPHASLVSRPTQRYHHHPSQVESEDEGLARFQSLDTRDFQGRAEDYREASPPAEIPKYLHEVENSEIYTTFKIVHAGIETPRLISTSFPYFDYASRFKFH